MAAFGELFEWRTIGAMTLRSDFLLAIAVALSRSEKGIQLMRDRPVHPPFGINRSGSLLSR